MSDIPLVNYDVPYFNQEDLGLGLVSIFFNIVIGYLFSSIRSPFDFGIILENIIQSIGFLNSLIGVSFQSPFTSSIGAFFIFSISITLTIIFYDVSFGSGLRKQTRYLLVFGIAFILAIPYVAVLSILDFVRFLPLTLIVFITLYLFHVGTVALGRLIATR